MAIKNERHELDTETVNVKECNYKVVNACTLQATCSCTCS